jgi:hypothetical protein
MAAPLPEVPVGRAPGEFLRESEEIDAVATFKCPLADEVLLGMMSPAQAYGVSVVRLEADAASRARAHMCALYRELQTVRHGAVMAPHPGSMCWP